MKRTTSNETEGRPRRQPKVLAGIGAVALALLLLVPYVSTLNHLAGRGPPGISGLRTASTFNPSCAVIYSNPNVCVSIAYPGEPGIIPNPPGTVSTVQPPASTSLPLYVKSSAPLNWTNAPYSGPDSPVTLNVTGTLWNGDPYYNQTDGSVWHTSTLAYWTGPLYVPSNRSHPWWYLVNISALQVNGQPNFFPGMYITWWIELTFNVSGKFIHKESPQRFQYEYSGAWPSSPYPGAVQFGGKSAFAVDLNVVRDPLSPNWNDTVNLTLRTTSADVATSASLGGGFADLTEYSNLGAVVQSTTLVIPTPSAGSGWNVTTLLIPRGFAEVPGSAVSVTIHAQDTWGDWIVSPTYSYTVNGNGSFFAHRWAEDLSFVTTPTIPAQTASSSTVISPGTPISLKLKSQNVGTAIAAAKVLYTVTFPSLGESTSGTIGLARANSTSFAGTLAAVPIGAVVNFTVEAWDYLQFQEVSPTYAYSVPTIEQLVPSIPLNQSFFLVAVHDSGADTWVTGAMVTMNAVGGFFHDATTTSFGLAYPNASTSAFVPILIPANVVYTINVSDPTLLTSGGTRAPPVSVAVLIPHGFNAHGDLASGSDYSIVEQGNLILFWLNATPPAPPVSPAIPVGVGAGIGLGAIAVAVVPLLSWWKRVERKRKEELKRVTL